ncbi:hypothetical protein ACFYOC_04865 [Nocardiopsis alba]|uniref:hypothetical protein n=1 Tax=Nocardiopsis alba TaxID=53437 RepID=UPI0005A72CB0|nr:hypothetical protein [Nocardiopsis alba]
MPQPIHTTVTLAGGLVLALTLSACGGTSEPADQESAAAEAPETQEREDDRPEVELVDPMEIAPDDLCTVLSEETLDELLGEEDLRSDPGDTSGGRPDPGDLEELDSLQMRCMLVSAAGLTLHFSMEVHEGLYVDSTFASYSEEDADPEVDLGDFAVTGDGMGGNGAGVDVVDGQVFVEVAYGGMGDPDRDEMMGGALKVAEEIMDSIA